MKKTSIAALTGVLLLSGCAGTRVPKLVKCMGPYRYANAYGTVLPSLPIPGQPAPAKAPQLEPEATSQPGVGPRSPIPGAPVPSPALDRAMPGTIAPFTPSC